MSLSLAVEIIDRTPRHTRCRLWAGASSLFHGADITRGLAGELTLTNDAFDGIVTLLDGHDRNGDRVDVRHYVQFHDSPLARMWTLALRAGFWFADCREHDVELADREFLRAVDVVRDHDEEHHR